MSKKPSVSRCKVFKLDNLGLTKLLTKPVSLPLKKIKIAHIINPVNVAPDNPSHLFVAQPITFQSMLNAQEYSKKNSKNLVDIGLYTAQYQEDREIIPVGFVITPDLTTSIHTYVKMQNKSRKLPRVIDILRRLFENSNADYFIYSNADIGIRKTFYDTIAKLTRLGFDSFCIHRSDLPKEIPDVGLLDVSLIEIIYRLKGDWHPGHDCFVFKRDIFTKLECGNVFVGYPPIGSVLKNQIIFNSKKFGEIDSTGAMTFHLGKDQSWVPKNSKNIEYNRLNQQLAQGLQKKKILPSIPKLKSNTKPIFKPKPSPNLSPSPI